MEMCYDRALVMPNNSLLLDKNEMEYIDGGVSLNVKKSYLDKETCKTTAKKYTKTTGLSKMRLAKEIYAHAYMYYLSKAAIVGVSVAVAACTGMAASVLPCLYYIRNHSNPIDLGGDSEFRVSVYNAIWDLF